MFSLFGQIERNLGNRLASLIPLRISHRLALGRASLLRFANYELCISIYLMGEREAKTFSYYWYQLPAKSESALCVRYRTRATSFLASCELTSRDTRSRDALSTTKSPLPFHTNYPRKDKRKTLLFILQVIRDVFFIFFFFSLWIFAITYRGVKIKRAAHDRKIRL